jgi:hypothetical protein
MTGHDTAGTIAGAIVLALTAALIALVWWMSRH